MPYVVRARPVGDEQEGLTVQTPRRAAVVVPIESDSGGETGGQPFHEDVCASAGTIARIEGILQNSMGKELWKNILLKILPDMKFLADAPDDPSVN